MEEEEENVPPNVPPNVTPNVTPKVAPNVPPQHSIAEHSIAEQRRADTATLCFAESVAVSSKAERKQAEKKTGAPARPPLGDGALAAAEANKGTEAPPAADEANTGAETAEGSAPSSYRDRRFGEPLTPEEQRKADVARQEATARLRQLLPGLKWLQEG